MEYAARAGTTTPFWTGATISTAQANYDGNQIYGSGMEGGCRQSTVAVDDPSFLANPFGLHHVHGNVLEWVHDRYRPSYARAPSDGARALEVEPKRRLWGLMDAALPARVLRGGGWNSHPSDLRSANRFRLAPGSRNSNIGFRVATSFTP